MILGTIVGTTFALLNAAGLIALSQLPEEKLKRTTKKFLGEVAPLNCSPAQSSSKSSVNIKKIYADGKGIYKMELILPLGMELEKAHGFVPGLELATNSRIQFKHLWGRTVQFTFGFHAFADKMIYKESELKDLPSPLAIPMFSPFGAVYLNFEDETQCHFLLGGASRMGKTAFLRLMVTHIFTQTEGRAQFLFVDNKINDLWMFRNIPQITLAETVEEATKEVDQILKIVYDRKELLKKKGDVVDAKEFRQKYPDDEGMHPIFVVIDEYGRFADEESFQNRIIELAETAGYLDVHLIIATQRPDSTSAIKPRIKANIVTRIAFSTADEANSKLILGVKDAAHLGRIQGRAIFMDGFPQLVQIPFITPDHAKSLLEPYYSTVEKSEQNESKRQENHPTPAPLPRFVEGSVGDVDLSRSGKTARNRKPSGKKTSAGRLALAHSSTEG